MKQLTRPKVLDAIPKEVQAKIVAHKISEPEVSWATLGRRFGFSADHVKKVVEFRLPQIRKHDDIGELLQSNDIMASLVEKRMAEKLTDPEERISLSELINAKDMLFKQNQLVTGGATERNELRYQGINVNVISKNPNATD